MGLALGRADVPLNERGQWQAGRLALALADAPLAGVYCSPLQRTFQTAEAIAGGHALKPHPRPGLIEMDIGEADGLSFAEVRTRFPGLLDSWVSAAGPESPMPGGERLVDVQRRAWDTVSSLAAVHPQDTICAVTHNFVILSVVAFVLGIDLAMFRRLRHGVAAISRLELQKERTRVTLFNDSCHLAG